MRKVLVGGLIIALILTIFSLTFMVTVYTVVGYRQAMVQIDGLNYGQRLVSVAQNHVFPLAFGGWVVPLEAPFKWKWPPGTWSPIKPLEAPFKWKWPPG